MKSARVMTYIARIMLGVSVIGSIGLRPVAAGGTGTWVQQQPRGASPAPPPFLEVQCPSSTACYALGSSAQNVFVHPVLERSTDGGTTWTERNLDIDSYPWPDSRPLSCPAVDLCYLLVNSHGTQRTSSIWTTTDGGQTWAKHDPHTGDDLQQISCPSATVCYVAGFGSGGFNSLPFEDLIATRDGGKTWASRNLSVSYQPLRTFTCPGIDDCYLSGFLTVDNGRKPGLAVTHDGGATWHFGPQEMFADLACASVNSCYAAGDAGFMATTDGGLTWTARTAPVKGVMGGFSALACPGVSLCYADDVGRVWRTVDGGTHWNEGVAGGPPGYADIACPALTVCYAVGSGGKIVKTTDGHTWQEPTPYTRDPIGAIACPLPGTCYAAGGPGTVLTTTNGGATWVRRSIGTDVSFATIACPASHLCFAGVGYSNGTPASPLFRTADGGKTWHGIKPSSRPEYVQSIACPSINLCLVAAAQVMGSGPGSQVVPVAMRTENGGRTWVTQRLERPFAGIACTTTRSCVGVGGQTPCTGDALLRAEVREKRGAIRPELQDNGCKVEGWLFVTSDSGLHWRRQWQAAGRALLSVSCAVSGPCYAGGYWTWGRSTPGAQRWSVRGVRTFPAVPGSNDPSSGPADFVRSLSCPSPSTCWALAEYLGGFAGTPVRTTDGGRSWQAVAKNVPAVDTRTSTGGLLTLNCPRPDRCFAGGQSGLVVAYGP